MDILIIDDDGDCVASLETALNPTGYKVISENNPHSGLELYKGGQFDVVITDVMMPVMSDIELMKALREFDPCARVIIMTAYRNIDDSIAAINHNAVAYLNKPINSEEFVALLSIIEKEISSERNTMEEYERLRKENEKLKGIYNDLLNAIVTVANI